MYKIDPPVVNESRTPEQNIQALKGWASEVAYKLTQTLVDMEETIESLRKEIEELKEEQDGV